MTDYYNYWGKVDGSRYHRLIYHCLDVAAVGERLLAHDAVLKKILCKETIFSEWPHLISFLLATHDIGKFSHRFQGKEPDIVKQITNHDIDPSERFYHDLGGYIYWFRHGLVIAGEQKWLPPHSRRQTRADERIKPLLFAVTGHHGKPPDLTIQEPISLIFDSNALETIDTYLNDICHLFNPDMKGESVDKKVMITAKNLSWLFAGLAVLADWIGSNQEYFPFVEERIPLKEYWNIALRQADNALHECGIIPAGISQKTGVTKLFHDTIKEPTGLQNYADECSIVDGPNLYIIEEATGGGKTEAAITLAHRIMATGAADGIFFALPTMATADAMYGRVRKAYLRLFEQDSRPSLILAHSRPENADRFRTDFGALEGKGQEDCASWLADSRKKALLAQVGIGTLDQALIAILPKKHQSLRVVGLARNVLIIDEAHAYDTYTNELLQTLIRLHTLLSGSVILLSATLPANQRTAYAQTLAKDITIKSSEYPLVTHVTREGILSEKHIPSRFKGKRTPVRMIDSEDEAIRLLLDTADAGGCACWVRNTVSDAMEAFDRLSQERPCLLFHARFTAGDRRGIEDQIKRFFGPESTVEERESKIVVATQVVEQSLDIDFDLMITDLAPIDLIIQRAGRLNRHKRDNRPVKPLLAILSPKPTKDASEDWYSSMFPRGSFVYSVHGELWLTARILEGRDHFLMPEDARELIESVYMVDNADQIPEKIAIRDIRDREERKSRAARAMMNAIVPEDGYVFDQMKWGDDHLLPTRLGDPSVTVRLLRKVGNTLQPWLDIGGDAWWTGEVNVRQYLISKNILMSSKTGIIEIPMHLESEGLWIGELPGRNENVVRVSYSKVRGISYEG